MLQTPFVSKLMEKCEKLFWHEGFKACKMDVWFLKFECLKTLVFCSNSRIQMGKRHGEEKTASHD